VEVYGYRKFAHIPGAGENRTGLREANGAGYEKMLNALTK
jgi:hypothetical protein